jgi:hypothetical protein
MVQELETFVYKRSYQGSELSA